jgi:hypothetical protein
MVKCAYGHVFYDLDMEYLHEIKVEVYLQKVEPFVSLFFFKVLTTFGIDKYMIECGSILR